MAFQELYSKDELKERVDSFLNGYKTNRPNQIPYKKHLQAELDVTRNTLYRYSKKYPELFEELNLYTQQMICTKALTGHMDYEKALYLLGRNYSNEDVSGITPKEIRDNTPNTMQGALIRYARKIGMDFNILD